MTDSTGTVDELSMTGRMAREYAEAGLLVFGPGPRKWTFTFADGETRVYTVMRKYRAAGLRPVTMWYLRAT